MLRQLYLLYSVYLSQSILIWLQSANDFKLSTEQSCLERQQNKGSNSYGAVAATALSMFLTQTIETMVIDIVLLKCFIRFG